MGAIRGETSVFVHIEFLLFAEPSYRTVTVSQVSCCSIELESQQLVSYLRTQPWPHACLGRIRTLLVSLRSNFSGAFCCEFVGLIFVCSRCFYSIRSPRVSKNSGSDELEWS